MLELVKKSAFVSLGLAAMSANSIRRIGKKIAEESKLSEDEGKKLVDDLLLQSEESKAKLNAKIKTLVKESLDEMDIVTKKDLEVLIIKESDIDKDPTPKSATKKTKAI